jgi:hypothetical protein
MSDKTKTKSKAELHNLRGVASFIPSTLNDKDNTIEVVFATERSVYRRNYGDSYNEVLLCRTGSVRLERINQGGAVLDTHGTYSLADQFGVVEKAWIDDKTKECKALIRLSDTDEDKNIVSKIKSGIIRNVSVQYTIYGYELTDPTDGSVPTLTANDWEPCELSFVPVPADPDSGSRNKDGEAPKINFNNNPTHNNNNMTPEEKAARAAERKRAADILTACRAANLSPEVANELIEGDMTTDQALADIAKRKATPDATSVRAGERARTVEIVRACEAMGLSVAFRDGLLDSDITLDEARAKIIDERAKGNNVNPAPSVAGIRVGADEVDKRSLCMQAAISQRAGIGTDKPGDAGDYRGMSLIRLAEECLTASGVSVRGLEERVIATTAIQQRSNSTGDFSYILSNVMNKTLRTSYDLQATTFKSWTRKATATDFKDMLRTQLNDIQLSKVEAGGEYKSITPGDSGERYRVAKYGKIVIIDWEAIINDDLSAFSRIPTLMAGSVAQLHSDLVYGILTGSQVMSDGKELFHADHGNLTSGPGTAISVASLGVGRQKMRDQKAPGGNILNIAPKYLIVGSQNEALALQFTSSAYQATKGADINVWAGLLTPIVDARITDKKWFLVADPNSIDTVEWAVLDGQELFTETKYGFGVDALEYKVRTVFAAKAIEHRSMYQNAGA